MAHGLNSVIKRTVSGVQQCKLEGGKSTSGVGSRRIFSPQFKLQVLDSYRNDADCKGNQRATARKYGIHRRQIQKWLQVENTLRNGVNGNKNQSQSQSSSSSSLSSIQQSSVKNEMSLNVHHRQRDDESSSSRNVQQSANLAGEARVSVVEPPSLWVTHNGAPFGGTPIMEESSSSASATTPMDLSLKKEPIFSPQISPIPLKIYRPLALPSPSLPPSSSSVHQNDDDVWDLSIRSNKRKAQNYNGLEDAATPKTIKLFKPYLDDLDEENEPNIMSPIIHQITTIHSTSAVSPVSSYTTNYAPLTPPEPYYVNNNNNNNNVCCDLMKPLSITGAATEFSPGFHPTFHELQPKSFYPSAYHHPYYPAEYHHHHHSYEEQIISSSSDPLLLKHHHQLQHRQSYNFDFKLSTIDCCYQENLCKGNPRAVIARYHIHRGEDWTSQELLRSSSSRDSLRESHIVR